MCFFLGVLLNFLEKVVCVCFSCLMLIMEILWCWEFVFEILLIVLGDFRCWLVMLIVEIMCLFLLLKIKIGLYLEYILKMGVIIK